MIWKKTMKKFRRAASICLGLCLLLGISVQAADTYTVSYKPGAIGTFSDSLYEGYVAQYGAENVKRSEATGSITITVPAGAAYPNAPTASDIILDEAHKNSHYVKTDWIPTEAVVRGNGDYVVDYGALRSGGVEYTVRFVDSVSGQDVASPVITLGNAGDVVSAAARTLEGYEYDEYLKDMVLADGGENVLTFVYTSTREPNRVIVEVPGETRTEIQTVEGPATTVIREVPGVSAPTPGGVDIPDEEVPLAPGPADDPAGTVIPDEEVPLAPGPGGENQEGQDIGDEEVPLGQNPGDGADEDAKQIGDEEVPLAPGPGEGSVPVMAIAGGVTAAGLLLAAILILVLKKKKEKKA